MPETAGNFLLHQVHNGLAFLQAPLFADTGRIDHAFSTRLGGVSTGYLASLNTAFHVGDAGENVLENRRIFFNYFQYDYRTLVSSVQVHGTGIQVFDQTNSGEGAFPAGNRSRCDALVTAVPGVPLTAYSADCQLIYFAYLENKPLVALAHAGWKGTLGNIGGKVIKYLKEHFSVRPERLLIGLGPVVCRSCYLVDKEVAVKFQEAGWSKKPYLERSQATGYYLDLNAINLEQLRRAGVKDHNIAVNCWCTSCSPELFYSYRRDKGSTGRMLGFIALNG